MRSNFVLFRLADDEAIYVADLQAGTVERRGPDEIAGTDLSEVTAADDRPVLKGLDFAFASSARSTGAGHLFFPNR